MIPGQNDFTLVELYAPLITKYVSVCGTKGEKSIKLIENKSNFSFMYYRRRRGGWGRSWET